MKLCELYMTQRRVDYVWV